jgi:hypothetical protein
MCCHSISLDTNEPNRIYAAISAAGGFRTDDGGETWTPINKDVAADFMPDDAPRDVGQCVHKLLAHPAQPERAQPQLPSQQSQQASPLPAVRAPQPVAVSLPDAVKAAHSEGYSFGESVGRDAPGLWLEAVLARKPRMPSDLEARLLQGSVLPIDSLLHDEVRHSLRRGFWDALESARR